MAAPAVHDTIGKYRILDRLGRGGMGTVLKAHDSVLDRIVALKVISSDIDARHVEADRLARGSEVSAAIPAYREAARRYADAERRARETRRY
jgi:serine/threonine protein kinase